MIKAVIFDCFGVLAGDGWLPYKAELFGEDTPEYLQATLLNNDTDIGKMSHDEFLAEIAKLAHKDLAEVKARVEKHPTNNQLFEFIRDELKPHYKIGLLSNASDNWLDELFAPWQVGLFDQIVLSCDVGYVKPDPRIYQAMLEKLDCLAEECLFIDDRITFCQGAEAVGIRALQYQSNEQTMNDIVKFTT